MVGGGRVQDEVRDGGQRDWDGLSQENGEPRSQLIIPPPVPGM